MRLLWVKAGRLLPVDSGGKLRSYHLARQLARKHALTMLTYYNGPRDEAYEAAMAEEFPGAVTLRCGPRSDSRLATVRQYLTKFWSPAPFAVTKFTHREVRALLDEWSAANRFDAMICDFLSASLNFVSHAERSILFQHNVESSLWNRQAEHASGIAERVVFSLEAMKMSRYEPRAVRRFAEVIAVSETDRGQMAGMTDPARITVVPTGVDARRFGDKAHREVDDPVIVFLGTMDWEANIDGVVWMHQTMWPEIRRRVPNAVFRIVGRNPHPRVRALAGDGIEVTGSVPSIDDYLTGAAVVVVPLRVGGGTRIKIFEAMSAGRAIVSTRIGAEGLPVTHNDNILLADDPKAFADAVVNVLQDRSLRRLLGRAAYDLACQQDWSVVAGAFDEVIQRAAAGRATN